MKSSKRQELDYQDLIFNVAPVTSEHSFVTLYHVSKFMLHIYQFMLFMKQNEIWLNDAAYKLNEKKTLNLKKKCFSYV